MSRIAAAAAAALAVTAAAPGTASADRSAAAGELWGTSVPVTNRVVSSPVRGGGYPVPDGATAPMPGTCREGWYNSNFSESWVAVKPGTEDLVGTSKFFFEKYSTFYDFHLGSFTIHNGTPVAATSCGRWFGGRESSGPRRSEGR